MGFAAGAYLFGLPDAVWEERHQMQERTERGIEVKKSDEAWAARKVERGDGRACNPETEFRLGFAAGTVDPFRWRGLYAIAAKRAAQYELVLREAGLPVRDALERDVFSAEDVAAAKVAALEDAFAFIDTNGCQDACAGWLAGRIAELQEAAK